MRAKTAAVAFPAVGRSRRRPAHRDAVPVVLRHALRELADGDAEQVLSADPQPQRTELYTSREASLVSR